MTYAIVHFWAARGGFGKRMEMLAGALACRGRVVRIRTIAAFWRLLRESSRRQPELALLVYTSLLAPLVALVRAFRPSVRVYYMVRGDEVTWAIQRRRRWRGILARWLGRLMIAAGCRFVFASQDLQEAFGQRLGRIPHASVLPNTLGQPVPPSRPFDGRVAVVGDFGSVKNIETVIAALSGGDFRLDLFGNTHLPAHWQRPWLRAHGVVKDLPAQLAQCSLVVLASVSEGFPNVLLDALQAGCGVVAHRDFPFRLLPLEEPWRFDPHVPGDLANVLGSLRRRQRVFSQDNPELLRLVESDWNEHVRRCLAA